MNLLKMAWRNVWRNFRRSGITIAAMTLALAVELLYSGLVTGLIMGMEDDATAYELGDVQIFTPGYLTRPSLYDAVEDSDALVQKLHDAGFRASGRLFAGGLAASGELSAGVQLVGLDPKVDAETMDLHLAVAEGQWLDEADGHGVVVGRGLARTLALELGDELIVVSQASDGSTVQERFEVRGILMSVAAGMDRSGVLMPGTTFREIMVFPEGAHKIMIRKPVNMSLADAVKEVRLLAGLPPEAPKRAAPVIAEAEVSDGTAQALPDGVAATEPEPPSEPIAVKDWKAISPFLAQYIDSVSGVMVILYFIIYVAVAILILNAMLMAVFERIREFGVLKAIGYGPGQVMIMMVAEGMFQAMVATLLGLLLAAPGMWYMETVGVNVGAIGGMQMAGMTMPPVWMGYYTVQSSLVPVVMLYFIVFFAVIYPALKAAWISPVEAMHHQ